jgi:phage gp37-like protein
MAATQFKLADVEQSIIATLKADAGIISLGAQVQGLSSKHFDDQGNIIVMPPAVLVFFEQGQDQARGDTVRTTYESDYYFCLFCGAADLTSTDKERIGAYNVVAAVRAAIAGKRLALDAGVSLTGPVGLAGVTPEQFDSEGAWYCQRINVPKTAQF